MLEKMPDGRGVNVSNDSTSDARFQVITSFRFVGSRGRVYYLRFDRNDDAAVVLGINLVYFAGSCKEQA